MKPIKILFAIAVSTCLNQCVWAQTFSSDKNREISEQILNAAINSVPFDSVYSAKKVYFKANELITTNSPLVLKRKGCRASIIEEKSLDEGQTYVVLGDFTVDWNNPTSARVQFGVMPENSTLGIRLIKEGDDWIIDNHIIFRE